LTVQVDAISGRAAELHKMPRDMYENIATVIFAEKIIKDDSLTELVNHIKDKCERNFIKECLADPGEYANLKVFLTLEYINPEDGQVGLRLLEIAAERKFFYEPTGVLG
jgi:hypothetical protein